MEMGSTFDTEQSCGTEALIGDAIGTQGIVGDTIVIRYSRNRRRRHRYPILKESSETRSIFDIQQISEQKHCSDPLGTQGIIGDAIDIQYSA